MTSAMLSHTESDPAARLRQALYRARLLLNRTPHLTRASRREGNQALDTLERQVDLTRPNEYDSIRAIELLNRAHPSIVFGLLSEPAFAGHFAGPLQRLGLRGLLGRLEEVDGLMAERARPIPGPTGRRRHRDDLPDEERLDAAGRPLPPPPGYY